MKTIEQLYCNDVIPVTAAKYILTALSLILLAYLIVRARCNTWTSPWFLVGAALLLGILLFSAQCGAIKCISILNTNVFQQHADRSWLIWILTGSFLGLIIGLFAAVIIKLVYKNQKP